MFDATPLFRLYAGRRARTYDRLDPVLAQERTLRRLLRRAAGTRFGRAHGFTGLSSVAAFQRAVPLIRYEEMWERWWQPAFPVLDDVSWPGRIPYLAATSGTTTGRTKYIPVSREMVVSNRRAALDILVHHLCARPDSLVLGGRNFMLGGSTALEELAPGVLAGDLSGIAANEVPAWARPFYFPPPDVARMGDWAAKVDAMGRLSLDADIRSIGGTASWLLLYLDRVMELAGVQGGTVAALYPRLELVVHGGVNFAPYRGSFERLLSGSGADLREVYPASEGFVAIADRGTGEGLRLIVDNGLFFEFVPVEEINRPDPTRHWLGTVRAGINYAIVLSSNAGLWSYVLGDTVRFVETRPPRILVTGRLSQSLSAFGEHLIGEELELAVTAAAAAIDRSVADFTVCAVHADQPGRPGGHLWIVEFAGTVPDAPSIAAFAERLDDSLSRQNADYKDHRAGGFGMAAPVVEPAPPGTFAEWMRRRGRLGGQNKVPRVLQDGTQLDGLRALARRWD